MIWPDANLYFILSKPPFSHHKQTEAGRGKTTNPDPGNPLQLRHSLACGACCGCWAEGRGADINSAESKLHRSAFLPSHTRKEISIQPRHWPHPQASVSASAEQDWLRGCGAEDTAHSRTVLSSESCGHRVEPEPGHLQAD